MNPEKNVALASAALNDAIQVEKEPPAPPPVAEYVPVDETTSSPITSTTEDDDMVARCVNGAFGPVVLPFPSVANARISSSACVVVIDAVVQGEPDPVFPAD